MQNPTEPETHTHTPTHHKHEKASDSHEARGSVLATIAVLIIAPIVALLLTAFVFQSYQVDGISMQSTLFNNDRLIVWKVPKTWSLITGHPYVPKRGDIVVFADSILASYGQEPGKQLIKRIIGLPGDHIVIKNNTVTIYNKANPKGFDPDKTLPYGKDIPATSGDVDIIVQPNNVFVMGDNRPDSLDSRAFGQVPVNDIVGKLVFRIWPAGKVETF